MSLEPLGQKLSHGKEPKLRKVLVLLQVVTFQIKFDNSTTAWEFMGQRTPENSVKLIFGHPLSTEDTFDPKEESIMNIFAEGSLKREEPQDVDME